MHYLRSIIIVCFISVTFLSLSKDLKAEETLFDEDLSTTEIPITRDGFLKSYWSPTFVWNGGYISIGSDGSVYKDGVTRGLFQYDLDSIRALGIEPSNIFSAELVTSFYRANKNTPRPFKIRIDPYDHQLPSKLNSWPERIDSDLTMRSDLQITPGQKAIDISQILKSQLHSPLQIDGVQLSADIESSQGIFFYSSECTKYDLFYNPECELGMEPFLRIRWNESDPMPVHFSQNEFFRTTLEEFSIDWGSEITQYYEVDIATDQDFLNIIETSPRNTGDSYQFLAVEYGVYYLRIRSFLTESSNEHALSETVKVEIFDLASYQPLIRQIEEQFSVEILNGSIVPIWEYSASPQFVHSTQSLIQQEKINKEEVCSHPTNRYLRVQLLSSSGNRSQFSDALLIDCPTPPTITKPDRFDSKPESPFNEMQSEKIVHLPERALENNLLLEKELEAELKVKGATTSWSEEINILIHDEWSNTQQPHVEKLKCKLYTDFNNSIIRKECDKLREPLKEASLQSVDNSTKLILTFQLPQEVALSEIPQYCKFSYLNKLNFLCYQSPLSLPAEYAFKIMINGKDVTPIYQKSSISDDLRNIELQIASADKIHITKIEYKIFLKGRDIGLIDLGTYTRRVDLHTRVEMLIKKPFIYPFNNDIGVTQWHGKTVFSDHTGIDFGSVNQEVRAIGDGSVVATGYDTYLGKCHSGGYFMNIKHTNGHHSVYLHLKEGSIMYSDGDIIKKGTVIATSGNSGAYNCQPLGFHLHMETREEREQETHYNPISSIEHDWTKIVTLGTATYPGRLSGDNPHPTY